MNTQINIESLAKRFAFLLREYLTAEQMSEVIRLNALETTNACHSHDFTDANEFMAVAFKYVTGKDWDIDSETDSDMAAMNEAWSMAKANHFYAEAAYSQSFYNFQLAELI